jgi:hypothetical protein
LPSSDYLLYQRADFGPDVERPNNNCERSLPKRQMQKPNRKQPTREPGKPGATIFDLDLLHVTSKELYFAKQTDQELLT